MGDLTGKALQKYQIEELIGRGGMAEVYRAYQTNLQRYVAIKVLHPHLTQNPNFIESFEREATAVARLRHPNILQVHDFDVVNGTHFMVMEHIAGHTLKADIQQRDIAVKAKEAQALYEPAEIAYILTALGHGLDYAHAQGIVHRDLKPSNIMFTAEGQAVITDFGLVTLRDQFQHQQQGYVTGTPAYMSPEQAQGGHVDHRSDIYTLGIILYELLIGNPPYHNETEFSLMIKQISDAPIPMPQELPQNEALESILNQALASDPDERYQSAGELATAYRQAVDIDLQDLRLNQAFLPLTGEAIQTINENRITRTRFGQHKKQPNPYRGLFAFREEDAKFFFGREKFVDKLVTSVNKTQIVPVIGPSGSGKSSVLFAGLVPRLREWQDWLICQFRPGTRPFQALSVALTELMEPELSHLEAYTYSRRLAQQLEQEPNRFNGYVNRLLQRHPECNHVLIIIDQFEEIFTLTEDESERLGFINCLTSTRLSNTYAFALSLRADFLGQSLRYPGLAGALQENPHILGAMNREDLTDVVIRPAEKQNVAFESGLVERMLDDVGSEPGNLPLLEFALDTLWDEQQHGVITHKAYEKIGRVDGALTGHAEKIYANYSPEDQLRIKNVFTQLVRPGLGTQDTRRLAKRSEVGEQDWHLVQELADQRLVVTNRAIDGQETAEVVHEALIGRWQRLRDWMNDDRNFRMWQERVRAAIHQWEENEHDPGSLLRGTALNEAEEWYQSSPHLNETESAFIGESIGLRDRNIRENELRRRRITTSLMVALLIVATLAGYSLFQWNLATSATAIAEERRYQAEQAQSRQLAVQSSLLRQEDFDLSVLLGVQANQVADTFEAQDNLVLSLLHTPRLLTKLRGHKGFSRGLSYGNTGAVIATGGIEGDIIIWETKEHQPIATIQNAHNGPVRGLDFNVDDTLLASVGDTQGVILWNRATQEAIGSLTGSAGGLFTQVLFSDDGQYIAASDIGGKIYIWSATDFTLIGDPLIEHRGQITDLAFDPGGRYLASTGIDQNLILWDINKGEQVYDEPPRQNSIIWNVAFHPNRSNLVTGNAAGELILWDITSGQELAKMLTNDWITSLTYTPNGNHVVVGERSGRIAYWNVSRRQEDVNVEPLTGHNTTVSMLEISKSGDYLVSTSRDGTAVIWRAEIFPPIGPVQHTLSGIHTNEINSLVYNADGQELISGSQDGIFVFWDLSQNPPTGRVRYSSTSVNVVAYSRDGRYIATGGGDSNVILWDAILQTPFETPLTGHTGEVISLAFNSSGEILATGSDQGEIILWDTNSRNVIARISQAHEGAVRALSFHPNSGVLVSAGADRVLQIWDESSGAKLAPPITNHQGAILAATFSPDGRYFASGGEDRVVLVWDGSAIANYRFDSPAQPVPVTEPLSGNGRRITTLTFNQDSTKLASGTIASSSTAGVREQAGNDTITLWDLTNFEIIGEPFITRHGRVLTIAFSPDGKQLASGGLDSRLILWSIDIEDWQQSACQRINREFSQEEWDRYVGSDDFTPVCSDFITPIEELLNVTPDVAPEDIETDTE